MDDGDTVTDFMAQERERGITIQSAAVTFDWKSYRINLIDTPGRINGRVDINISWKKITHDSVEFQDMLISPLRLSGHFVFLMGLLLCSMLLLVLRLITAYMLPFSLMRCCFQCVHVLKTPVSVALNLLTGADTDCVAASGEAPYPLCLFS